ncbi:MAG: hypothetical protein IJ975_02820 [Clostridia bacterium]|nr:hypothetical protein [Clostridia bacterium]
MEIKENSMEQPSAAQVETPMNAQVDQNLDNEKSATSGAADGSIGKFKNTESLLHAYNSLQAEFTRKCQRLSELESKAQSTTENVEDYIKNNQNLVGKILKHYVAEIQNNPSPVSISDSAGSGIPLMAPPKPTTMEEAKEVVKNLFK